MFWTIEIIAIIILFSFYVYIENTSAGETDSRYFFPYVLLVFPGAISLLNLILHLTINDVTEKSIYIPLFLSVAAGVHLLSKSHVEANRYKKANELIVPIIQRELHHAGTEHQGVIISNLRKEGRTVKVEVRIPVKDKKTAEKMQGVKERIKKKVASEGGKVTISSIIFYSEKL